MAKAKEKQQQKSISHKNNDYDFDLIHGITNQIRIEEEISQPVKNSLSYLVYHNKTKELKKRLQTQESPDARDVNGDSCSWTPLYWGVKLRRIECVQLLLEFGADINIVINDFDECCGTVLDLATLRNDDELENLLRKFAEKEDINLGQSFKAIRSKLRGKAPAFNFRYYGKKKLQEAA